MTQSLCALSYCYSCIYLSTLPDPELLRPSLTGDVMVPDMEQLSREDVSDKIESWRLGLLECIKLNLANGFPLGLEGQNPGTFTSLP